MDIMERIFGIPKKRTPLLILSEETQILFLSKRLNSLEEEHSKAHKEICEKYNKQKNEIWEDIVDILKDRNIVQKNEELEFSDGVLYEVEDRCVEK